MFTLNLSVGAALDVHIAGHSVDRSRRQKSIAIDKWSPAVRRMLRDFLFVTLLKIE